MSRGNTRATRGMQPRRRHPAPGLQVVLRREAAAALTDALVLRFLPSALIVGLLAGGASVAAQNAPRAPAHRRPSGRGPASRDRRARRRGGLVARASRSAPSSSRSRTKASPLPSAPRSGSCSIAEPLYRRSSASTPSPTRSSSARAAATPTSPKPIRSRSSSIRSTTGRTRSSSGPIRSGSSTTAR